MDDIVLAALAKWPKVPHCYGWLGLDERGQWFMRDAAAQAAGDFDSGATGSKGSWLKHDKLIAFIQRNYAHDEQGQWFFQNGPQRVYVELQSTPYVWRVGADLQVRAHTDQQACPRQCLTDEQGHVYLETDLGFGLVHTQDVIFAAQAIESGVWPLAQVKRAALAQRFGFVCSPQRAQQEKGLVPPAPQTA